MGVTILDVAKEAGVSKSTVSLVINHSPSVKQETQYKVQEAIKKLNYVPNFAARGLPTSRTQTLGMIFLTSNSTKRPFAFDAVSETLLYDTSNGIYELLAQSNYALLTERFSVGNGRDELPTLIQNGRVDGVFLIGGLFTTALISRLRGIGLPVVVIGRQSEGIDCIYCNMEEVGYLAGSELLDTGHRRILFVNGPESSVNSQLKLRGFQRALQERGMPPDCLRTVYSRLYTGQEGYHAVRRAWESGPAPDALFGGSDGITAGILRYLYKQQIRVPDDVSLVGYESSILTEYAPVSLTVIDAHKERMGQEACKALLNRIQHPRAGLVSLGLSPALLKGGSVVQR